MPRKKGVDGRVKPGHDDVWVNRPFRLPQKLRPQHQALDLVGAGFDLVIIVGEVNVPDHGAALEHRGRSLQLQILDQRDAVALGEFSAVGIPDLDVPVVSSLRMRGCVSSYPSPLWGGWHIVSVANDVTGGAA